MHKQWFEKERASERDVNVDNILLQVVHFLSFVLYHRVETEYKPRFKQISFIFLHLDLWEVSATYERYRNDVLTGRSSSYVSSLFKASTFPTASYPSEAAREPTFRLIYMIKYFFDIPRKESQLY